MIAAIDFAGISSVIAACTGLLTAVGVLVAILKGQKIGAAVQAVQDNTTTSNGTNLATQIEQIHNSTAARRVRATDPPASTVVLMPTPAAQPPSPPST